jgi:sulfatase modifying factor 1
MSSTLLTLGIILLLVGLIGHVKAKEIDVGTKNVVVRIILSIIGLFFVSLAIRDFIREGSATLGPSGDTSANTASPILPTNIFRPPTSTPIVFDPHQNSTDYHDEFGVPMRLVPAGTVILGGDNGIESVQPVNSVILNQFYLDKYEVTNALYQACVNAAMCQTPSDTSSSTRSNYYKNPAFENYPVIYVSWYKAKAFCEWRGARLPTEAEWMLAARGTDSRLYPWGDIVPDTSRENFFDRDTDQVGGFESGQSVYGLYDMSGNVWEWVSSLYMQYPYQFNDGREDPNASGDRVLLGGGWTAIHPIFYRGVLNPNEDGSVFGFRCARSSLP